MKNSTFWSGKESCNMVIILPIGAVFLKVGTVFTARKEETCSPLLHRPGEMASKS